MEKCIIPFKKINDDLLSKGFYCMRDYYDMYFV